MQTDYEYLINCSEYVSCFHVRLDYLFSDPKVKVNIDDGNLSVAVG